MSPQSALRIRFEILVSFAVPVKSFLVSGVLMVFVVLGRNYQVVGIGDSNKFKNNLF